MSFLENIEQLRAEMRSDEYFDSTKYDLLSKIYQHCERLDRDEIYDYLTETLDDAQTNDVPEPNWPNHADFVGGEYEEYAAAGEAFDNNRAKLETLPSLITWLDRNPEDL